MFSHVMVGSNDIARSKAFYDAVLGILGASEPFRHVNATGQVRFFYSHDGGRFGITEPIDGEPATCANGATIGFRCDSAEQVAAFHAAGLAHGGTAIENPPGVREGGSLGAVHLAYLRDPDGNKLCASWRVPT